MSKPGPVRGEFAEMIDDHMVAALDRLQAEVRSIRAALRALEGQQRDEQRQEQPNDNGTD